MGGGLIPHTGVPGTLTPYLYKDPPLTSQITAVAPTTKNNNTMPPATIPVTTTIIMITGREVALVMTSSVTIRVRIIINHTTIVVTVSHPKTGAKITIAGAKTIKLAITIRAETTTTTGTETTKEIVTGMDTTTQVIPTILIAIIAVAITNRVVDGPIDVATTTTQGAATAEGCRAEVAAVEVATMVVIPLGHKGPPLTQTNNNNNSLIKVAAVGRLRKIKRGGHINTF